MRPNDDAPDAERDMIDDMGLPATSSALMTADQLETLHLPGKSTELVRGQLVVREPPSTYHGIVSARLAFRLGAFVYGHHLGELAGQDTGFKIAADPDTVRAPDIAFISAERAASIAHRGYAPLAPDLVVEIVSPDERRGELLSKISEWLEAGVRLVWVIDPDRREAHVHRADGSLSIVNREGSLDGEDVLPGFSCGLAAILTPSR